MEDALKQLEAQLQAGLPPAALERVGAIDAWGEAQGIPHAGTLAVLVLCLVVLLASVALLSGGGTYSAGSSGGAKGRRGGRGRKDGLVLLVGPCGGGKTAIYHRLLYGALPETVTSMEESEGQGSLQDEERGGRAAPFRLVDAPGHPRLRGLWTARVRARGGLRGVVLVVDSADFGTAGVREAADFLYDLLTHPAMDEDGPLVLVACNKSDAPGAKSPSRIKTLLTQELERLRKTKGPGAQLGGAGAHGDEDEGEEEEGGRLPLGRKGQPLALDVDAPTEVSFAAVSAAQADGAGLAPLEAFVLKALRAR